MNEIVAACTYHDGLFIFTRTGEVYLMLHNAISNDIEFRLITRLFDR